MLFRVLLALITISIFNVVFARHLMRVSEDERSPIVCTLSLLKKYFNSGESLSGSVLSVSITSASMHIQKKLIEAMHQDPTFPWTVVVKMSRQSTQGGRKPKETSSSMVLHEKPQCYFVIIENLEDDDLEDIFEDWKATVNWNPLAQFVVYMVSVEESQEEMTELMIEILLSFMNRKIYNINVIGRSEENEFLYGKTSFPFHTDNNCGNRVIAIETLDLCDYQEKERTEESEEAEIVSEEGDEGQDENDNEAHEDEEDKKDSNNNEDQEGEEDKRGKSEEEAPDENEHLGGDNKEHEDEKDHKKDSNENQEGGDNKKDMSEEKVPDKEEHEAVESKDHDIEKSKEQKADNGEDSEESKNQSLAATVIASNEQKKYGKGKTELDVPDVEELGQNEASNANDINNQNRESEEQTDIRHENQGVDEIGQHENVQHEVENESDQNEEGQNENDRNDNQAYVSHQYQNDRCGNDRYENCLYQNDQHNNNRDENNQYQNDRDESDKNANYSNENEPNENNRYVSHQYQHDQHDRSRVENYQYQNYQNENDRYENNRHQNGPYQNDQNNNERNEDLISMKSKKPNLSEVVIVGENSRKKLTTWKMGEKLKRVWNEKHSARTHEKPRPKMYEKNLVRGTPGYESKSVRLLPNARSIFSKRKDDDRFHNKSKMSKHSENLKRDLKKPIFSTPRYIETHSNERRKSGLNKFQLPSSRIGEVKKFQADITARESTAIRNRRKLSKHFLKETKQKFAKMRMEGNNAPNSTTSEYPKLIITQLNRGLFLDKFPKDLSGCPLIAAYRPWEPYIFSEAGNNLTEQFIEENNILFGGSSDMEDQTGVDAKMSGIEYELVQTIAQSLHISVDIQTENKNVYHLFQQLIDGEIEMVFGGLDEDPSISQYVSSTIPYHQDDLTWCVAKAKRKHDLFNFLNCFELETWLLTLLFIIGSSLNILFIQEVLNVRLTYLRDFLIIPIRVFGIILNQSVRLKSLPTVLHMAFGTTFFMGLMFSNIYQSFLVSTLSTPSNFYQISQVQEIYKHRMMIMGNVENVRHLNKDGVIFKYLREKFEMCYNIEDCLIRAAVDDKLAVAVSRQHMLYNPRIPRDRLYCFGRDENLYVYLVTMLLPKKFHLLHKINPIIQYVIESGHMQKWARDLDLKRKKVTEAEETFKSLSLAQVAGSFLLAGCLLLLATLIFMLEVFVHWMVKKRRTRLRILRYLHKKF